MHDHRSLCNGCNSYKYGEHQENCKYDIYKIGDLVAFHDNGKNIIGIITDKQRDSAGPIYKAYWNDDNIAPDQYYSQWQIESYRYYLEDILHER